MHVFKDDQGREWELAITVSGLKRVRDKHGIDLTQVDQAEKLGTDTLLASDVVYTLLQAQAEERKVDAEAFGARLGGVAMGLALAAFWGELTDFFQNLRRGLPGAPPSQITMPADSNSSTGSPALSESTPPPSP